MRLVVLSILLFFSVLSQAQDTDEIQNCLSNWKDHPFKESVPEFRTLVTRVKVLGIGGDLVDDVKTNSPELILVKPNVTVMSKSILKLLNPNGWYCLKGKVSVLGKSEIHIHCNAKLTSSNSGAVVLGSDKEGTGVTVLGATQVKKIDCEKAEKEE